MPTKIQGGLGIDKVQDGAVGMSDVDTELYGKITALTTINLGEAKTATGTFVDFDVPLGVKRVTVMFDDVSTNGTSQTLMQIGSSSFENTGYSSSVSNGTSVVTSTSGFILVQSTIAAASYKGSVRLDIISSNRWVESGVKTITAGGIGVSAGVKTISGTLDRIRITTVNGTDQFDAGTINISWEF